MRLYALTAYFNVDSPADEYFSSKRKAISRAKELQGDAVSVKVTEFTLAKKTFKETVLACLNQVKFIEGGTQVDVYSWDVSIDVAARVTSLNDEEELIVYRS
jgi:hypothetical protein